MRICHAGRGELEKCTLRILNLKRKGEQRGRLLTTRRFCGCLSSRRRVCCENVCLCMCLGVFSVSLDWSCTPASSKSSSSSYTWWEHLFPRAFLLSGAALRQDSLGISPGQFSPAVSLSPSLVSLNTSRCLPPFLPP